MRVTKSKQLFYSLQHEINLIIVCCTLTEYSRASSMFQECSKVSSTFQECSRASSTFQECSKVSSTFQECSTPISGEFQSLQHVLRLCCTFQECSRASSTFQQCSRAFSTFQTCLRVCCTFQFWSVLESAAHVRLVYSVFIETCGIRCRQSNWGRGSSRSSDRSLKKKFGLLKHNKF